MPRSQEMDGTVLSDSWKEPASTRPYTFFLLTVRSLGKGYFWHLPLGHGIVHLPILTRMCPSLRTSLLWTISLQISTGLGKLLGSKVNLMASWWRNGVFGTKIFHSAGVHFDSDFIYVKDVEKIKLSVSLPIWLGDTVQWSWFYYNVGEKLKSRMWAKQR